MLNANYNTVVNHENSLIFTYDKRWWSIEHDQILQLSDTSYIIAANADELYIIDQNKNLILQIIPSEKLCFQVFPFTLTDMYMNTYNEYVRRYIREIAVLEDFDNCVTVNHAIKQVEELLG